MMRQFSILLDSLFIALAALAVIGSLSATVSSYYAGQRVIDRQSVIADVWDVVHYGNVAVCPKALGIPDVAYCDNPFCPLCQ